MSKVSTRERCPSCDSTGNDRKGDNLAVFEDGGKHCFACGYAEYANSNGKRKPNMTYKLPPVTDLPVTGIKSKAISLGTCKRFNVQQLAALDDEGIPVTTQNDDGSHKYKGSGVITFPYYDIDSGTLIGCKLRKGTDREFWFDGDSAKQTFFGIPAAPASSTKLVITEGETDTLSIAQVMSDVAVYGVPGASSVEKCIRNSLHVLRKFKSIVILFDNDQAGRDATEKALKLLPAGKAYVAQYPAGVKDANQLLVEGQESEIRRIIRDAKQVVPKGIVDGVELKKRTIDYILNRDSARGATTGYAALDDAIGGLTPGKVLTVVSGTGAGKSTFVESLALNSAIKEGCKTFFIALEMMDTQVMTKLAQAYLHSSLTDPSSNPDLIPRQKLEEAIDFIDEHIKFFDHFGAVNTDKLVEVCELAVDMHGVQVVVLDHITAAATGTEGMDWKALDATASALKSLAIRKQVCVVVVAHISRDGDNEEKVPKLRHIRGGNGIAQYSDVVLAMGRKRNENKITMRTEKPDRMIGKFVEFVLRYENCTLVETGEQYDEAQDEDDDDELLKDNKRKEVSQQVRGRDSSSKPSATVRDTDNTVHDETHLLPRLGDAERGDSREQGAVPTGGQNKDVNHTYPTPTAINTPIISAWDFETEPQKQHDLPRVG